MGKYKFIYIGAIWCPSCLIMRPRYKELINNLLELDLDFSEEVKNYEIGDKLPILIIEQENKEKLRIIGEKTKEELVNILKEYK